MPTPAFGDSITPLHNASWHLFRSQRSTSDPCGPRCPQLRLDSRKLRLSLDHSDVCLHLDNNLSNHLSCARNHASFRQSLVNNICILHPEYLWHSSNCHRTSKLLFNYPRRFYIIWSDLRYSNLPFSLRVDFTSFADCGHIGPNYSWSTIIPSCCQRPLDHLSDRGIKHNLIRHYDLPLGLQNFRHLSADSGLIWKIVHHPSRGPIKRF